LSDKDRDQAGERADTDKTKGQMKRRRKGQKNRQVDKMNKW